MNTLKTVDIINSMVPISRFNRGEANKIFSEVKSFGTKIVVKNNTPECVLISPTDYQKLLDDYENLLLAAQAESRYNDGSTAIPHETVMKKMGFSNSDLDDIEVEFE